MSDVLYKFNYPKYDGPLKLTEEARSAKRNQACANRLF